ncbi:MAG: diguanylate cyclase [Nitrospirae bacterium]|nr:diguanylate cyclase [Nitrospirota bacterium]
MTGATVLVVEDSPENLDLLRDVLASRGYNVLAARDGTQGLALYRADGPDLVLLDLRMPGLSGMEVLRSIRESEGERRVPVIVITGSEDLRTKVHTLDAGADDFLAKPFEPKELLARVKAHLRAKELTDDLRFNLQKAQQFAEFGRATNVLERADLERVLREHLPRLCDAELFSVYVINRAGTHIERWADNHPGEGLDPLVEIARPGIMERTVKTAAPVTLMDYGFSEFTPRSTNGKYRTPFAACYPLARSADRVLGVLNINNLLRPAFDEMDHLNLTRVSNHLALAVRNIQLHEEVREQSRRDSLTGLLNHGSFMEGLENLFRTAVRHHRPLAVVMLDVDHFKLVNDRHGHPFGDRMLVAIARALTRETRQEDLVARYGGEEFALALPETDRAGAVALAERILARVREVEMPAEGESVRVTVSGGAAVLAPEAMPAKSDLVRRADEALYAAKSQGRDRVAAAG